jgi:ATP-dependent Clp endopeptidase proteolytic subunit ClpP
VSRASWYDIRNVSDKSAEVAIYDEIGLFGISAKEFSNSLKSLGDRRLTVRIHSPGGEIFEGSAVYNALRRHKGGVDVAIDGLAASMATVIAMAGEKRSMAENAMFMIHNPIAFTFGESKDLRKEAELMDDLKETIITTYASRTGMDRDELSAMMDEETWLNAKEAKKYGFVTEITESLHFENSFDRFDISRFAKRPTNFMPKKIADKEEAAAEVIETPAPEAKVEIPVVEAKATFDIEACISDLKAAHADILAAKDSEIAALKSERDKAQNLIAQAVAETIKTKEDLIRVEVFKGLAPAAVVVQVPAEAAKTIFEQYMALEGAEQTAFYKANQAELLKHFNKAA